MTKFRINYLYRDAANYKNWASVVVDHPDHLTLEEFSDRFIALVEKHRLVPDVVHFKPEEFGWETAYFDQGGVWDDDDFPLHELENIELALTDEPSQKSPF